MIEEIPIIKSRIIIGREHNNDIVIDNLAVSRHHVKIFHDDGCYFIEDLNSGNGTFVNDKQVTKDILHNGDEILVGKHTLVFVNEEMLSSEEREEIAPSLAEETVILSPKTQQELISLRIGMHLAIEEKRSGLAGSIAVLSGGVCQKRIELTKQITVGGKSHTADIKLRGVFVGAIAFMISKRPEGFFITHSQGKRMTRVNSEVVEGQRELQDGDIITIGSTTMQFSSQQQSDGR